MAITSEYLEGTVYVSLFFFFSTHRPDGLTIKKINSLLRITNKVKETSYFTLMVVSQVEKPLVILFLIEINKIENPQFHHNNIFTILGRNN